MRMALAILSLHLLQACRSDDREEVSLPPAPPAGTVISYAEVVDRVAPAVVTIRSERVVRAPRQFPFFDDPFFRDFFGDRFGGATAPREQIQRGLGSGVIITKDGYVLTNFHVIDGAEEIRVELANNRGYDAKVIGADQRSDLAVLKIAANDLPMLTLGDSDRVRVGDVVLAVGNPLGIGQTVTAGIISAKGRTTGLSDGSFESFLQTDAPINQGNSGGALVNTPGELVGINSQIISPTGGNIGIGFAIPANMARSVAEQLIKSGKVRRGHLGVTIQPITSDMAASLGLKDVRGVIVSNVEQRSPAERAGLKQGDVITAINGNPVNDSNSLRNLIATSSPGTDVTITILRDGREQQLRATLGELPSQTTGRASGGNSGGEDNLGLTTTPMTPELAARLGLRRDAQGLVVTDVDPGGAAGEAGLQPGDVIEQVNRQPVRSSDDLKSALARAGDRPPLLLINRRGSSLYLTLRTRG
ncbi:MAG: Periplasmic pH-dependent serine endoprotease DegQ [Acidobacteria bacterium]|nr:Periplasmic pH-dependent serine endoprotease DegQ [Acidobacteriota bacterium]